MARILDATLSGETKTKIILKAHLLSSIKWNISRVLSERLIEHSPTTHIRTTEKGRIFLQSECDMDYIPKFKTLFENWVQNRM
jgi:predicted transcriptional regulator